MAILKTFQAPFKLMHSWSTGGKAGAFLCVPEDGCGPVNTGKAVPEMGWRAERDGDRLGKVPFPDPLS